jgi:hypothetical protein
MACEIAVAERVRRNEVDDESMIELSSFQPTTLAP